jgi:hypothetical protein
VTKQKELKEQIERAFSEVPYPGDDRLIVPHGDDCDDLAAVLRGQHWRAWKDNPLGFLRKGDADQHFTMTVEAIRFFYPLYLLAALTNFDEADLFRDAAVRILISPRYDPNGKLVEMPADELNRAPETSQASNARLSRDLFRHQELVRGFSPSQIAVIKELFSHLKAEHPQAIFVVREIDIALRSIAETRGDS